MGFSGKDTGDQIDYWVFKHRYTLYAFDLPPSFLDGDEFEIATPGLLAIELKFERLISSYTGKNIIRTGFSH